MAVKPFSKEELNFFKFASIVHDEFPKMLRSTFVTLWDRKIAPLPGYQVWDDSPAVRTLLLTLEGGTTPIPTNDSFEDWDCTALFKATIYSKTFAISTTTTIKTLSDKFLRGKKPSPFHASLISPTGNQDETITLAIDQVRLLRNTFCHLPKLGMTKPVFDDYVQLVNDAFTAVGFLTDQIDYISCLKQSDFPTERVDELKREIRSIELEHRKFLEEKLMTTMNERWEIQMFFNEYFSQNLEEIRNRVIDNQTTETECSTIVQENREFAALGSHHPELSSDGGVIVFRITAEMARKDKDKVLDTVSLVEILYSCEQIKPSVFHEALEKGFGDKTDQKFGVVKPTCLLVPLYCLSDERFLEVLDDFESGRLKQRLLEEFSQFRDEIKIMEIELMKMEEVNKTKDDIKRKYV
ncbi:uncharacterized protein LOC114520815 [Dendronephthya gigantea]|uniref:uncharacterized protein LOC114520815 n=1 Tax=Dendronephthya gigantea TaxID=151771 RepID=UPI00106BE96A|nr:uncharacterized protein LOC114520815 [Dendronephthya gigantea]